MMKDGIWVQPQLCVFVSFHLQCNNQPSVGWMQSSEQIFTAGTPVQLHTNPSSTRCQAQHTYVEFYKVNQATVDLCVAFDEKRMRKQRKKKE